MTDQMDAIQTILTDVDEILRERLKENGTALAHIIVAIGPDGSAIIRGNVDPAGLLELAKDITELAEEAMQRPDDGEPIH